MKMNYSQKPYRRFGLGKGIGSAMALVLLMTAFLASCGTKRKALEAGADATTTVTTDKKQKIVTLINDNRQTAKGIRSKMSVRLSAGSKGASASGTLKMKRDEIIQLSLTALGLFEVGRLELTPEYLFVQDRMNKQYVQVKWADIDALKQIGADFYTFQSLFWNELFLLNKKDLPAEQDFQVTTSGKQTTLTPTDAHIATDQVALQFLVNTSKRLTEQAQLKATQQSGFSVTCDYDDFDKLDKKTFPHEMKLAINAGSKRYAADINLSSPQVDEGMKNLATKPSNGYKQVSFDNIIKQLIK